MASAIMYLNQKITNIFFADELKMLKKISGIKDVELDQMKLRVKTTEGKTICACICS